MALKENSSTEIAGVPARQATHQEHLRQGAEARGAVVRADAHGSAHHVDELAEPHRLLVFQLLAALLGKGPMGRFNPGGSR